MFFFVLWAGENIRWCGDLCAIGADMHGDYGHFRVSGATPGDRRDPNPFILAMGCP